MHPRGANAVGAKKCRVEQATERFPILRRSNLRLRLARDRVRDRIANIGTTKIEAVAVAWS